MVDGVVGPGEVKRQQDELLRSPALHRATPGLRPVPPVLHLLDQTADVLLCSASATKADLLRRDQLVPLNDVGEACSDHPLGEFRDVARQRDGPVAASLQRILA